MPTRANLSARRRDPVFAASNPSPLSRDQAQIPPVEYILDLIRRTEGPDGGDGTVPLWSAVLSGATVYYIQEIHRYLPRNKQVIEATLDLIEGGTPDLPMELPPLDSGWLGQLFDRDLTPPAAEAEQLRTQVETGVISERDLSSLYLAM
jgi:hypothetical protein